MFALHAEDAALQTKTMGQCPHCGNTTNPTVSAFPYCCGGCKSAHEWLQEAGLNKYYTLRGDQACPIPTANDDARVENAPILLQLQQEATENARQRRSNAAECRIDLQGLQCTACTWLIEKIFARMDGAISIELNPAVGNATLRWALPAVDDTAGASAGASSAFQLVDFAKELARFGYRIGPAQKSSPSQDAALIARFGIAVALAMNSMIFSIAIYFGLAPSDGFIYTLFVWANFVASILCLWIGGTVFFKSAWMGLRLGSIHMDLPISIGILLSFGGSTWALLSGNHNGIYFDTVNTFTMFMLLGRLIQQRALRQNQHMLLKDNGVDGMRVRRVRVGSNQQAETQLETISVSEIRINDTLLIAPGEIIPVGSVLQASTSQANTSQASTSQQNVSQQDALLSLEWIDGEAEPRSFAAGDVIKGGARNVGKTAVRVSAQEAFQSSLLADLFAKNMEALSAQDVQADPEMVRKYTPTGGLWQRWASGYSAAVLLIGTLGFLLWMPEGTDKALRVATALLVVTCPCALGIAAPLAYELANLQLRQKGIFLRRPAVLDRLLRVKHVLLDKTGTLTLSTPAVTNPEALRALSTEDRAALWQMVQRSNHPKSQAVAAALSTLSALSAPSSDCDAASFAFDEQAHVEELSGNGMSLRSINPDTNSHTEYRLGNALFCGIHAQIPAQVSTPETEKNRLYLTKNTNKNSTLLASLIVKESAKQDAGSEITALQQQNLHVHILSGDAQNRVNSMAGELGIPAAQAHGNLSPEDKAQFVSRLPKDSTLMIGDGINDSLAFGASALCGTPAIDRPTLPAKSDFYIVSAGIGPLSQLMQMAHKTRRTIIVNMVLAVSYNLFAITIGMLGWIEPWLCAIMMPISTLIITGHTVWSFRRAKLARDSHRI